MIQTLHYLHSKLPQQSCFLMLFECLQNVLIIIYSSIAYMLKVHSVFPQYPTRQTTAIQTQSFNKYPHLHYSTQVFKNCKLRDSPIDNDSTLDLNIQSMNVHSMTASCTPSDFGHQSRVRNFRINKKQNMRGCKSGIKMEATKFNFIKFEDKLLNQALKKYIKRIPLTKIQKKELQKKITIYYLLKSQPKSCQLFDSITEKQQHKKHELRVTVKQIVQSVVGLSQKTKDTKKYYQEVGIKRIEWKVQKLLASKQPIIIHNQFEPTKINLQTIIKSYINNIEQQCLKPIYNNKGYLQHFYEQIFMRYESIPFCQQNENDDEILQQDKDNGFFRQKSKRSSMRSSIRNSKLNKLFVPQKLSEFENNFRKQMKILADQSQRILMDQNRKVSKF